MAIQIVKQFTDEEKYLSGAEVTVQQINDLSENLFLRLSIMENGKPRAMSCADRNSNVMNDTRTAYFTKASIYELFAENSNSNGLLIYFGVHNHNIYPLGHPHYENKLMVVLATAKDEIPNLNEGNKVQIAGSPFEGAMDNGKLCPPNTTCGG